LSERLFAGLWFLFCLTAQTNSDGVSRYDVDEKLDDAIGARGLLVAIGNKRVSYGSAKLTVRDEDWKEMFAALAKAAKLIVMLPGPSASVLWEISQLVSERGTLAKTVFAMPREHSHGWAKTAASVESDLGVKLPAYKTTGCYFRIDAGDLSISAVELEAFTTALAAHLANAQQTTGRALEPSELWQAACKTGATTVVAEVAPA
jgi:hypothetical protein